MNPNTPIFDQLSDELACCILARLTDEQLKIFAASSVGNRLLVNAADAYGREICVRALGEKGLTLDPYVISKTEFIGINFLRFQGILLYYAYVLSVLLLYYLQIQKSR